MLNLAKNLLKNLDFIKAEQNSFGAYHNIGVDYLNLLRTPELTAKLYFFDPIKTTKIKVYDERSYCDIIVHPHNHLYNFETFVIKGSVQNINFRRCSYSGGYYSNKYEECELDNKTKKIISKDNQKIYLDILYQKELTRGESYKLDADQVHSIDVSKYSRTILFLLQYKSCKKSSYIYFTKDFDKTKTFDNLYQPLGFKQIEELRQEALSEL